jgi:short subunit dehydrogenase-like uncharacterized protein
MSDHDPLLVYGANGYTGRLIVKEAVRLGMRPVLSGRNAAEVNALAAEHGLVARPCGLDSAPALDAAMAGCTVVLHCAGPFSATSRAMADACIRNSAHYLDITGEISVFEGMAARGKEAEAAGVMLMPGVGFDVVPSDCLAAHLKRRLPSASWLTLAFNGGVGLSRGTATTMIQNIGQGGAVRRNGKITRVPAAWRSREIAYGDKPRLSVTIPWGDVSTAWHSTRIPNIEVYTATSKGTIRGMILSRYIGWLLETKPAQNFLLGRIRAGKPGPSDSQRERAQAQLWGEAWDDDGNRVASRLRTPDGYTLTAITAVAAARKVLAGGAQPGYRTPSMAFGPDFILEVEGAVREDLPQSSS